MTEPALDRPSPRRPWRAPAYARLDTAAATVGPNPTNAEGIGRGS